MKASGMTEEDKKTARLVTLANRFYQEAEAPDEEAMDSLFFYLARRNEEQLKNLLRGWNVDTEIGEETGYLKI